MSHPTTDQAVNATLGALTTGGVLGFVTQEQATSLAMLVGTIGVVGLKFCSDLWTKRRDAKTLDAKAKRETDTAEFVSWRDEVSPEVIKRSEFEGENNFLRRRVGELEAENKAQAAEMQKLRGGIRRVGTMATENQTKVDAQEERIAAIEQVVPPPSNPGLPTT